MIFPDRQHKKVRPLHPVVPKVYYIYAQNTSRRIYASLLVETDSADLSDAPLFSTLKRNYYGKNNPDEM